MRAALLALGFVVIASTAGANERPAPDAQQWQQLQRAAVAAGLFSGAAQQCGFDTRPVMFAYDDALGRYSLTAEQSTNTRRLWSEGAAAAGSREVDCARLTNDTRDALAPFGPEF